MITEAPHHNLAMRPLSQDETVFSCLLQVFCVYCERRVIRVFRDRDWLRTTKPLNEHKVRPKALSELAATSFCLRNDGQLFVDAPIPEERTMPLIAVGLQNLPVELLYEVQLYALSENLPLISHHFNDVFSHASSFFHAKYILGRTLANGQLSASGIYSRALRYPICSQRVLLALNSLLKGHARDKSAIQLPRRLFRSLSLPASGWTEEDYPLPLLRYLYHTPDIPGVDTNANNGYALTRAVHAKFTPLVLFLLEHHASPQCHESLAVKVAIRQKNLEMVKILVERPDKIEKKKGKKRKMEDRLTLDSNMLRIAVTSGAQDLVEYLYREKNVLPDVQTLKKMAF